MNETLKRWHQFVATQNPDLLDDILAEDCVFHSPVVWKPKTGRPVVKIFLMAASTVLKEFEYIREVVNEKNAVLEFEARIGELTVRGVDLLKLDQEGRIIDFEVMLRPANAIQAISVAMSKALTIDH
ncbi:MAG: nuclear transport factor 2 family protein [Pyrinomonadaceae bacterium]|nr:nuclear transport factor 2 family protein [Pyrinomonadaceae bacterium]